MSEQEHGSKSLRVNSYSKWWEMVTAEVVGDVLAAVSEDAEFVQSRGKEG